MVNKAQALEVLTLLAALESWSFSLKEPLPDYLHERLADSIDGLVKIVLGETNNG